MNKRLRKMNLPSVMYWKIRNNAMEAYKYLHDIYKVNCSELLPLYEQRNMRIHGHNLKLKKRSCRAQLRQKFFSNRIVNIRNNVRDRQKWRLRQLWTVSREDSTDTMRTVCSKRNRWTATCQLDDVVCVVGLCKAFICRSEHFLS